MLWSALGKIENGFYIDVGANDPVFDSVTKFFYDNGWKGINVEPIEEWAEQRKVQRPKDISLKVAAGVEPGEITLFSPPDTGLTTSDRLTAERHERDRRYTKREVVGPVQTLTGICREHGPADIRFIYLITCVSTPW